MQPSGLPPQFGAEVNCAPLSPPATRATPNIPEMLGPNLFGFTSSLVRLIQFRSVAQGERLVSS